MTFVRLLALGLLLHESFAVCKDGAHYLRNNFVPTLGLRLGPRVVQAVHLWLIATCIGLIGVPDFRPLHLSLWIALTTLIASYPLRLSNHLVLAWFFAALLCIDQQLERGVQGLVLMAYAFACVHKLNGEYFRPACSCAVRLTRLYWNDRGIDGGWVIRISSVLGIYGVLLFEGAMPIVLGYAPWSAYALPAAVAFHLMLSLLCVMHFSMIMYAGLVCFVPFERVDAWWDTVPRAPLLLASLAGVVVILWSAPSSPYRSARWVRVPQGVFGAVSGALLASTVHWSIDSSALGVESVQEGRVSWPVWLVWALFMFNGLTPYLGIKTEFCLAMFSNLRHAPWRHLLVPAWLRPMSLARYVEVEALSGLPTADEVVGDQTARLAIEQLSRWRSVQYSSYFFDEACRHLAAHGRSGRSVAASFSERGQRYVVSDYASWQPPPGFKPVSANLFPYVLPRDADEPHCK
jgi:hypothetical protein